MSQSDRIANLERKAITDRRMVNYLTDIEVSRRYGVSRATVWRWSKAGRIPSPVHLGPNTTRWRLTDLEEFEAGRPSFY